MDIFLTFHVFQREMIKNNNNLSYRNIGGEVYLKRIYKLFMKSEIGRQAQMYHSCVRKSVCHVT
jgi:hypothetical protein